MVFGSGGMQPKQTRLNFLRAQIEVRHILVRPQSVCGVSQKDPTNQTPFVLAEVHPSSNGTVTHSLGLR